MVALTYSVHARPGDFELPAGARDVAKAALKQFLPSVEASRAHFGFNQGEELGNLQLEAPIPATTFDVAKLESSSNPDDANSYLNPVKYIWFPVSLDGHFRGIVSIVLANHENRWLPEAFGKQQMARVLEIFTRKYPPPNYQLEAVYAPASQDAYLIVNGLTYNNLTCLPNDEASAKVLAEKPPAARVVLGAIVANLAGGIHAVN